MAKKVRTHYGLLDFTKPFPKSFKVLRITGWIGLAIGLALCVKEVLFGSSGDVDAIAGFLIIYGIGIQISVGYSHLVWKIGSSRYKKTMEKQEAEKAAEAERKRVFEEEHPHYKQEQFYLQCKAQGIKSVDTPADVARLVLFAKNKNYPGTESQLIEAYKTGEKDVTSLELKKELDKLKSTEEMLEKDSLRYKETKGQLKRILMCRDQAKEYRKQEESYRAQSRSTKDAIFQGTQGAMQKETDWATHGGIASGIAGPAAGLAVASDIQRKNAQIREQNAALTQLAARAAVEASRGFDSQAYEASQKAEEWEARATAAENKLVENLPEHQLLEQLCCKATAHQSKTGAITVEVKITATKELKIYETVPAIVDGGLQAQILDGTDYVGTAYLPLPWNGSEFNTTLKGICRNPVKKAKKYTVKVEPYYLWAMEK